MAICDAQGIKGIMSLGRGLFHLVDSCGQGVALKGEDAWGTNDWRLKANASRGKEAGRGA
jgi:hypothetical protein